jgi:outer membrane protein OmpA-like peptidoglycan-associated protein
MKKMLLMVFAMVFLLGAIAGAGEWKDKTGVGFRGGVFAPLNEGKDYNLLNSNEPFMMGPNGGFDLRRGVTDRLVLDFTLNYVTTYDDTTETDDQSFKFANSDNAYVKLNAILAGGLIRYYMFPSSKIQPFLMAGIGVDFWKMTVQEANSAFGPAEKDTKYRFRDFNVKYGAGFNFWLGENTTLDLQALMTQEIENVSVLDPPIFYGRASKMDERPFTAYIEPTVGLTFYFGGAKDSDNDGVPDKKDQCPDTPMGATVDINGCPTDSDGDGVFDGIDNCPDTPMGAIVDMIGCPLDTDQDGVPDGIDRCANTPPGVSVDNAGCPLDTDKDGVFDTFDKCPDTPTGCKVEAVACNLDGDGDGVCDGKDRCPTTPAGTPVNEDGCPLDVKKPVQKITLNIKYATGKFDPDPESKKVLDDLIVTMKNYTGVTVEVQGFTDDVGSEKSNQTLSEKRAGAVKDYIVAGGVAPERVSAKGFGEDPAHFVADNKTAEGRAQNRRVDLVSSEF